MSIPIETLNTLADGGLEFALAVLLQSSVLIVVLLLIEWVLRRRVRAAVRYGLLLLVLAKLALPPGLASPTALAYWLRTPANGASDSDRPPVAVVVHSAEAQPDPAPHPAQAAREAGVSTPTMRSLLLCLWASGILVLFTALLRRSLEVRRIVALSAEPSADLKLLFDECRGPFDPNRKIRLRITNALASPALCGLLQPVILIPATLVQRLSAPQLLTVLLHELIHVPRRDLWIAHLQSLLQIFYWWHPLLWIANRRLRQVREEAVDDAVILSLPDAAEHYPSTLLEVAKVTLATPLPRLGFLGILESPGALGRRIRRLLDEPPPRCATLGWPTAVALTFVAALLLPMARASTPPAQTPPAVPPTDA